MEHWTHVLKDWVNPESDIQLKAFAHVTQHGTWPTGYYDTLPSKVQDAIAQSNGLWTVAIDRTLAEKYLQSKGYLE
jgi:hypothetical protein